MQNHNRRQVITSLWKVKRSHKMCVSVAKMNFFRHHRGNCRDMPLVRRVGRRIRSRSAKQESDTRD